jgi:hypothetical protein
MRRGATGFALCCVLLAGCASVHSNIVEVAPEFPAMEPTTIVVLPAQNETVDMDAPGAFRPVVEGAVPRRGYRIVPPERVDEVLAAQDVHDPGQVAMYSVRELGELFHADAVLYTVVTDWHTTYLGIYAEIAVAGRFELFDSKTETLLWKWDQGITDFRIALDRDTAIKAAELALRPYEPYVKVLVKKAFATLPSRAGR